MLNYSISKILVPVDFSPTSLNALDTAVAMAKRHNASVVMMHVVETGVLAGFPGDDYISEETISNITHDAEEKLQLLKNEVIREYGFECETLAQTGFVTSSIVNGSNTQQADIIVLGTHGVSGVKEFLLGSNAYNVIKHANCPVLTVPSNKKWLSFKNILFPVRPIPGALEKYDYLRKIISRNNASLRVLGLSDNHDEDIDVLRTLAAKLKDQLDNDHVHVSTYFKVGQDMAAEVLKMADLLETDLIVITATIDSSFREFFAGPYTQHIVNHSHYPVLSIKPASPASYKAEVAQHLRQITPTGMDYYSKN